MGNHFVVDTMVKVLDPFGWMKLNVAISTVISLCVITMKSGITTVNTVKMLELSVVMVSI